MPDGNGLEFLRTYDVIKKHPNVKVIAFSNLNQPQVINEAVSLGASNYLTKAFTTPKEIVQMIRETLSTEPIAPIEPS